MSNLRELHLQGNRLTVLPPQLGQLDFLSSRAILKLDNNPWVPPIEDQLILGVSHVIEYIRTETYKYLYNRHIQANVPPPEKGEQKNKKIMRKRIFGSVFISTNSFRIQPDAVLHKTVANMSFCQDFGKYTNYCNY